MSDIQTKSFFLFSQFTAHTFSSFLFFLLFKNIFAILLYFCSFLLEYSCFMLCQFLLCSKVNQLHVYICSLFFGFPSHLGQQSPLSRVPYAIQQVIYFIHNTVYKSIPTSQFISRPFPSLGSISLFSIYVYVFVSTLQIRSCAPFFQIPRISVNIQYLFFSF